MTDDCVRRLITDIADTGTDRFGRAVAEVTARRARARWHTVRDGL